MLDPGIDLQPAAGRSGLVHTVSSQLIVDDADAPTREDGQDFAVTVSFRHHGAISANTSAPRRRLHLGYIGIAGLLVSPFESNIGKLARHGVARIGHAPLFHDLLEPAQVCRYLLGRKFPDSWAKFAISAKLLAEAIVNLAHSIFRDLMGSRARLLAQ